jgi:hypothetical protein
LRYGVVRLKFLYYQQRIELQTENGKWADINGSNGQSDLSEREMPTCGSLHKEIHFQDQPNKWELT